MPGDSIEFSITLSHDYQTVRSGCTTTIRPGETAEQAQERAEGFCIFYAKERLKEIS